ncbi:MAG: tetraacyldisaccharide 4'-kinase [Proteobacteria bacterium]|nr:tetraacyldisaccharide 4'-kinase [Pseudomonadota bacterium]
MIKFDPNRRFNWKNPLVWGVFKGLSIVYGLLHFTREALYLSGFKDSTESRAPVISVGNITVGGTGKTPMISWLLDLCTDLEIPSAVLTRGYKSDNDGKLIILNQDQNLHCSPAICGDEPWMLARRHSDTTIYVSSNRVESAKVAEKDSKLLLLDDGMQHLQLKRDLEIVLVDTVAGFGNHCLLPFGPLREPLDRLKKADIIIYTKTNLRDSSRTRDIVSPYLTANTLECDSQYLPRHLISTGKGEIFPCAQLENKRCLLFSGIGNPQGFEEVIKSLKGEIVDHLVMGDHHVYDQKSLLSLQEFILTAQCDFVICTEKDWVKLEEKKMEVPEFYYLEMKMVNEEGLNSYLFDFFSMQKLVGDT